MNTVESEGGATGYWGRLGILPRSRLMSIQRSLSFRQRVASLASVALVMVSCDAASVPAVAAVPLTPVASSLAPLARGGAIALATEETACVIDTYRSQVHCIHRRGEQTQVFGQRGQGPGEFASRPQHIVRGPNGTVGVIGMRKMAVFEPSGLLVTEVGLPGRVRPAAPIDSALMGELLEMNRQTRVFGIRHVTIDVGTGDLLWERVYPASTAAEAECAPQVSPSGRNLPTDLGGALRFQSGGLVFTVLCRGQLLFLAQPDDDAGIVVQPPSYTVDYPGPKEVERYLDSCESPERRFLGIPCQVEEFRRTPKRYGVHYWVDDQDRLWVLTERDREEFSYLDVYVGTEFAGSLQVRHRAVGFDVSGSTLVVLVDRPVGPDDPDGFPDRGIDWYDIGGLGFGTSFNSRP